MGDAREGEIVNPRGEIEILDHDLGEGVRIGGRRGKISINPDFGGIVDFRDERGELGKILLVIVVRRLLLDRAGIGRGTVEVADILIGIAQGVVTVAIFDQLVGEALGVERELVEFAVQIEAHGIVERCARTVVVEELERKVLAQERGVGIFGGEGTLADFCHFRARHGVGASQGLGLVEAQTMRFLRERGARIAAQVDADIIVIKTGRRIVDAAARVVGNDRKILIVGVLIHLHLTVRIDEKVQRLQGRGKLVGRRLDNRAIPFVAVVGIFERWRAEGAVCAVGNVRGEKDASAGGRDGRGGDGCGIDIAEQFVSRRGLAHGNFVSSDYRSSGVDAIKERDRLDGVVRGSAQVDRVDREGDRVGFAHFRERKRLPRVEGFFDTVQRGNVRTVGNGISRIVRRARSGGGKDLASAILSRVGFIVRQIDRHDHRLEQSIVGGFVKLHHRVLLLVDFLRQHHDFAVIAVGVACDLRCRRAVSEHFTRINDGVGTRLDRTVTERGDIRRCRCFAAIGAQELVVRKVHRLGAVVVQLDPTKIFLRRHLRLAARADFSNFQLSRRRGCNTGDPNRRQKAPHTHTTITLLPKITRRPVASATPVA